MLPSSATAADRTGGGGGALGPTFVSADAPVTIDGVGTWTLTQLGSSDIDLPIAAPLAISAPLAYELPNESSQGPSVWYLLHLHASITMTLEDDGLVDIIAQFNGCSAALIEFTSTEDGAIEWEPDSALDGDVSGRGLDSNSIDIYFSNFLPQCGVVSGTNELVFQVEEAGGSQVVAARVHSDTSIEVSNIGPPDLEITPAMPNHKPRAGEPFEIGYWLTNTGREARGVTVTLLAVTAESVDTLDSDNHPIVTSSVQGALQAPAMEAGRHRLVLSTSSDVGDRPVADITVDIGGSGELLGLMPPRQVLALALVLLAFGLLTTAALSHLRQGSGTE